MNDQQAMQLFVDELAYQREIEGVEEVLIEPSRLREPDLSPPKKEPKLTKTQRKFAKTLQRAAKYRRDEIASIARVDPMLKAFFTKTLK